VVVLVSPEIGVAPDYYERLGLVVIIVSPEIGVAPESYERLGLVHTQALQTPVRDATTVGVGHWYI
jgi:hypothetical protein